MRRVTILAYHSVGACPPIDDPNFLFVSPESFDRQMSFLAERRSVVRLADLVSGRLDTRKPAVAVTFDDAYRSVLDTAGPILTRFGFPATIFVPTAWVGSRNGWDADVRCPLDIMTPDELRAAEAMGMEVESHGHAHVDLAAEPESSIRTDLAQSIDVLSGIVGRKPRFLAYPWGHHDDRVRRIAREVGFERAFSIDQRHAGDFAVGRVPILRRDDMRVVGLKTSGFWLGVRRSAVGSVAAVTARRVLRGRGGAAR